MWALKQTWWKINEFFNSKTIKGLTAKNNNTSNE